MNVVLEMLSINLPSIPATNELSNWGQFGDFFGGILNPILTLINIGVTIYLTKVINDFSEKNTKQQIEAEKKIAVIHIKQEAVKELSLDFENQMKLWKPHYSHLGTRHNNDCLEILFAFQVNYGHLFDLKEMSAFSQLVSSLYDHGSAKDNVELKISLVTIETYRHAFFAALRQKILE